MAIRVLGPLETGNGHTLSPRERVVLAALVVRVGRDLAPGELADACWGESPPRTWQQQVKTSVARIRASLGSGAVVTRGSDYSLGVDPSTIDAFEFERLVSAARRHVLRDEHDRAIDLYRRALALWRGNAYADIADWDPAAIESERLAEIRHSAQEELLEARLAEGEHRAVIADADRLVREAPLRENRWAILAIAAYRSGRQAEALATLRASRERMASELGIDVGDRLRTLETAMLQQDPTLELAEPRHFVSTQCPYVGLEAFTAEDAEQFFGRDADIDAIRDRMRPGAIVVVIGASGSGKSSLVRAGIVPRVSEGHRVAVVTAGRDAAVDLRAWLEQRGTADLVVVDQAEAVFQLPAREQEELCSLLAQTLAAGTCVVMTLRSDFVDRATGLPGIGADVGRGVFAIGPLSVDGLREAVERPAVRAGIRLEPGLVEVVVRDAGDRRTTLPHISHALVETWARREGATMTVAGYEASGGIGGAIAQSAETLYRSLDAHDAEACRSLMLRLVHRGADGVSVRRTATLAPLVADPARRGVLDLLVAARLLSVDGEEVTVAHEAIATAWPRLDGWLEEDAEGARLVTSVAAAADVWDGSGRRPEDLLRGARLRAALDWRDASHPDLTVVERAFLEASASREQDDVRELAERAARDKRNNRRLRWAVAGAGVLLVAAVIGGTLAAVRGTEAAVSAENASVEALVATSLSLQDNDRETAALLAAEAYRRWPDDPRVRSALWGVMTQTGGLVETHHDDEGWLPSFSVIPGSREALRVEGSVEHPTDRTVDVLDVETGDVIRSFDLDLPESPLEWGSVIKVSPDGSTAAVVSPVNPDPSREAAECCWNRVTFFDPQSGKVRANTGVIPAMISPHLVFDDTAETLYATHVVTADLIAIDVASGRIRASSEAVFEDHPAPLLRDLGLGLIDDRLIAVGAGDHIRVYDRFSLALLRTIPLDGDVAGMDLLVDGQGGIVSTGWDGTVRVDLSTGETVWRRFLDQTRNCDSLHVATETTIACGSYDGFTLVDLATGETKDTHVSLQVPFFPVFETLDADSLLVWVGGPFSMWMRWRVDGGNAGADMVAKGRELVDGPELGGSLAVTQPAGGGRMLLWDLDLDVPVGRESDRIVPLGSDVVAHYDQYDGSGAPRLERISTGAEIAVDIPGAPDRFEVHPGSWGSRAFAWWPEGEIVAFDPATGKPLGPPMRLPTEVHWVEAVSETPDGTSAVITWYGSEQAQSETAVFDIASGALLVRGLHGLDNQVALEGGQLVGIANQYARRYDIGTLEPISALARAVGGGMSTSASTDGRTLLNVGANNAITLYDLTADIALASPLDSPASTLRLLDGVQAGVRVPGGFLTADGETLLEARLDGIRVWDLRPAEQAARACAVAGRELTPEEWSTYFPDDEQVATCALLEEK
jgi:DNA-binding SARP family transcriptional activator/energy-coupling factor transporter ATP-binding protein EcfA2